MEEKFKSLEEKENEMRQFKTLLRERDRDIERANQMLLTAEESIDVSRTPTLFGFIPNCVSNWRFIELPYWYKSTFLPNFWEF